jgi:hypothetical protein
MPQSSWTEEIAEFETSGTIHDEIVGEYKHNVKDANHGTL